ncbi:Endothelin-converting enzyme 2 [Durusdinium trenchii]|uniref:Endothelin-converting enzyme 2 n=1 Tax=Durusdinium trenchii TaxID=1381693 RepID=A0ABP0KQM2_9DINO
MNGAVLRRRRTKSSAALPPPAQVGAGSGAKPRAAEGVPPGQPLEQNLQTPAGMEGPTQPLKDQESLPDETPLEQLLEMETDLLEESESEEDEAIDIFVHRSKKTWVITPLSGRLELRSPRSDGLPPPGCTGVIWRLDEGVLRSAQDFREEEREDMTSFDQCLGRSVSRRLQKVSSGMRRLRGVTEKLEEKLAQFQEEKLELERKQRRVNKSIEESAKEHAELTSMREKILEDQNKLKEERARFDEEVRQTTDELAKSKRALSAGHCAVLPPHVLFLAAQDEFVRASPDLNEVDQASLQSMRAKPEAAFSAACSLFFTGGSAGADALVGALLASQSLLDAQAPRIFQSLEQLLGLSQAVARAANVDGRMRLSFAASSCTLWCSWQLSDYLSRKWEEVNVSDTPEDLDEEKDSSHHLSVLNRRIKLLAQAGSSLRRSVKTSADYWDHRRRFIRCLAKPGGGGASEADLRLLFLPRDAKATELAAHVRRLSGVVEDLVVMSSRKRSLEAALPPKRPSESGREWRPQPRPSSIR